MKPVAEVKILIVEDDPLYMLVLKNRMTSEGYQVMGAADGRAGMKAIVTFEPDLVISDWMMPEVDGLELCQAVKTGLGEAAPYFILLTAKGQVSDKLLGLQGGADEYLTKPCDAGELMARVHAGVRIVSLTQELRRTVADLRAANAALRHACASSETSAAAVTVCSGCRRLCADGGTWQALDQLAAPAGPDRVRSLCPDCERAAVRESRAPLADAA